MPRLPRIYIEGAVYFISCRGQLNQDIFKDEKDYQMFLELLKKYNEQYDIKIFAYVLMPDHLHLLVEMTGPAKTEAQVSKSQEMSEFMHSLNNAYTKYFNSRYDRKGHLFRERFKAALVEKENYLLKMTVYLHLNPQKLNLVSDAGNYPYSSLPLYLGKTSGSPGELDLSQEIAEIFSLLGNKTYADFVKEMSTEEAEFLHKRVARGGILGSDEFVRRARSEVEAYQSQDDQETPEVGHRYRLFVTTGGLVLIFAMGLTAGTYFYFVHKKPAVTKETKPIVIKETRIVTVPEEVLRGLNNTEWEVKLIPASGGTETVDTLSFVEGKFVSAKLASRGYNRSNYSLIREGKDRVVWETMQSFSGGTASWHGEMEEGKMSGILSLRQEGKPAQDFSFIGITYRRRE